MRKGVKDRVEERRSGSPTASSSAFSRTECWRSFGAISRRRVDDHVEWPRMRMRRNFFSCEAEFQHRSRRKGIVQWLSYGRTTTCPWDGFRRDAWLISGELQALADWMRCYAHNMKVALDRKPRRIRTHGVLYCCWRMLTGVELVYGRRRCCESWVFSYWWF